MESRFKFRAWNFKENKYYQQNEKGMFKLGGELPNGTPVGVLCGVEDLTNNRNYGKNFVVEQCTGLKDKNGKLIYEGDIIKVTSPKNWNIFDEYSNSEILGKGVVVTKPGCAFIKKNDIDGEEKKYYFALYSVVEDADVEVIGNIHENPELLEEDK